MKVFGVKFNLYLVIAGVLLVLLLTGSTGCGCLNCGAKEAFSELTNSAKTFTNLNVEQYGKKHTCSSTETTPSPSSKMLMWAGNEFKKEHCLNNSSNYHTRDGCVCPTEEQLRFLSSRGGNSTSPTNI